jgi:hypothetical protein
VEALKNGLSHLPYDGALIFAAVNADQVNWIQTSDGWANTSQGRRYLPYSLQTNLELPCNIRPEKPREIYQYKGSRTRQEDGHYRAVQVR